jgi:hypothetical protein
MAAPDPWSLPATDRTFVVSPTNPMLLYTRRTRLPGWYVAHQTGCLIRFAGRFPSDEAARASLPRE